VPLPAEVLVRRDSEWSWTIAGERLVLVDPAGLPVAGAAESWPLEEPGA
jgi:hypothetical protein